MRDEDELTVLAGPRNALDDGLEDESVVEVVFGLINEERTLALNEQDGENRRALLPCRKRRGVFVVLAVLQLQNRAITKLDGLNGEDSGLSFS